MTSYALLLRGVNLGGRRVTSAELKELARRLGHQQVRTYINSGNVLLGSDREPGEIAAEFELALAKQYDFGVDVMIRSAEQLAATVAANPYPDGNPTYVVVGFTKGPIDPSANQRFAALATPAERFTIAATELYADFPDGQARSKLAGQLAKAVGQSTTARNLRTVTKLAELSAA
jgi:uncharacterized protein (DUF1697 family)